MRKTLYKLSVISLIFMFLALVAGSIVRVSDSGMGCPDWPKCFGYYIPPTSAGTLKWQPQRNFREGNMILKDSVLLAAKTRFRAGAVFNENNWEVVRRQNHVKFNATHTWIEYSSRLIGALSAIPVVLLYVVSVFFFKRDPQVTLLALLGVLLLGFEAWLNKAVVDGRLITHEVSVHMLTAVILILLYTYLIVRLRPPSLNFKAIRDNKLVVWGVVAGILFLVQIFLGTAVREEIDSIGKSHLLGYSDWKNQLSVIFKIHRTFSIAVLIAGAIFAVKVIRTRTISTLPRVLLVLIFVEAFAGIGMAYFHIPDVLQPLHLVVGVIDVALLFAVVLIYRQKTKKSLTIS